MRAVEALSGGVAPFMCYVPGLAGVEGTGDGWVGEGRSEDHVSRKVTVLPAFAVESRRLRRVQM